MEVATMLKETEGWIRGPYRITGGMEPADLNYQQALIDEKRELFWRNVCGCVTLFLLVSGVIGSLFYFGFFEVKPWPHILG